MPNLSRQVYVISDLHLGGVYAKDPASGDRGFRICTHAKDIAAFIGSLAERPKASPAIELVVNGDMVDFLAEHHEGAQPWKPFNPEPKEAVALLEAIVARDREVFDAMAAFLAAGHRMTVLLGNHDVELALPQVRAALRRLLDAEGRDFTFIHDGEAYLVGDALIEHGNDYDDWNRVNFAQLRRVRAMLSREQRDELDFFEPPAGSFMVAEVINPVKEHYRFVDLLKPETGACFPLLLALAPGYKPKLLNAAKNRARAMDTVARRAAAHEIGADISSQGGGEWAFGGDMGGPVSAPPPPPAEKDELSAALADVLGSEAREFTDAVEGPADAASAIGGDISSGGLASKLGWARLLFSSGTSDEAVRKRLPALLQALRATQGDRSFDRSVETGTEYLTAARKLAQGPVKHVIFGHTHLPKRVALPSGGYYLNSGTWADVLRFPEEMVSGTDDAVAMSQLEGFVEAMKTGDFSSFTLFHPTYVRLDVDDDGAVVAAELCDYEPGVRP